MPDVAPNVILILADQLRADCLGFAGRMSVETPHLDQLAERGVRFSCAYSACPSSSSARAALLTGMDHWHTGLLGTGRGGKAIHHRFAFTLPRLLAEAGYHTQGIGRMGFSPARTLMGFHNTLLDEKSHATSEGDEDVSDYLRWFERHRNDPKVIETKEQRRGWFARPSRHIEQLHPVWWTTQSAIDWLSRSDPVKPKFLMMCYSRPRPPYDPPQQYFDMYRAHPVTEAVFGDWSEKHDVVADIADPMAWRGRQRHLDVRRARQGYFGNVTFIDYQLGRLFNWMGQHHDPRTGKPMIDNTWFVFLSDHGDMLGDHHLWRKTHPYEASTRVPLVLVPPKTADLDTGTAHDPVVELRDVMPTLLDLLGRDVPDKATGRSLAPLLRGETLSDWRQFIHGEHVWCYSHEQANHFVTDGREKLIWFPYLGEFQYFDLERDPDEKFDFGRNPEAADRVAFWKQRLIDALTEEGRDCLTDGRLEMVDRSYVPESPHWGEYACRD